jgi:hypothetical protein
LATVDATDSTGRVEVHANNSAVSVTATGNSASAGVFEFTGGSAADTITGGGGADILIGSDGADTITGGGAADVMTGGTGSDTIVGGTGSDDILYISTNDGGATGDVVTGFVSTADDIIIDGALETTIDITANGGALVTLTQTTAGTAVALDFEAVELVFLSKEMNAAETNSVSAANLSNLTLVSTLLGEAFTEADGAGIATVRTVLFAVESSDDAGKFGLYHYTQSANNDATIGASEMGLLAIGDGDDILAADFSY